MHLPTCRRPPELTAHLGCSAAGPLWPRRGARRPGTGAQKRGRCRARRAAGRARGRGPGLLLGPVPGERPPPGRCCCFKFPLLKSVIKRTPNLEFHCPTSFSVMSWGRNCQHLCPVSNWICWQSHGAVSQQRAFSFPQHAHPSPTAPARCLSQRFWGVTFPPGLSSPWFKRDRVRQRFLTNSVC